jgi:hypothetical protein
MLNNTTDASLCQEFKPTWLYIKQHNVTGLKYFGRHTGIDPIKYAGSGTYWRHHIKKHSNDVSTIWCQLFNDKETMVKYATTFSVKNNIVESKEWANLMVEDGVNGSVKGRKMPPRSEEMRKNLSAAKTGERNGMFGKTHTDEVKQKHRNRMLGTHMSEDAKQKSSMNKKGKSLSESHRANLSVANKGIPWTAARRAAQEAKKVNQKSS